ncbi:MAG: TetR family transcriptional regulator [Acidimicrobiales bacterium]
MPRNHKPVGRKEGARRTRRDLLDAASTVFAREGYSGASVASIAAEAGRTTGALFAHFDSKEELFLSLLEERAREKVNAHNQLADDADPGELDRLLNERFDAVTSGDDEWDLLATEFWLYAMRHPRVRPLLAAQYHELRSGIGGLIERQLADHGRRSIIPIEHLAATLIALGDGLGQSRRLDSEAVPATLFSSAALSLVLAFSAEHELPKK